MHFFFGVRQVPRDELSPAKQVLLGIRQFTLNHPPGMSAKRVSGNHRIYEEYLMLIKYYQNKHE